MIDEVSSEMGQIALLVIETRAALGVKTFHSAHATVFSVCPSGTAHLGFAMCALPDGHVHSVQISWILVDFDKEIGSGKLYPMRF